MVPRQQAEAELHGHEANGDAGEELHGHRRTERDAQRRHGRRAERGSCPGDLSFGPIHLIEETECGEAI